MAVMDRRALLLVPLVALAACTGPSPQAPVHTPAPAATTPAPSVPAPTPTQTRTPDPLPSIPPKLPNEVIRATFDGRAAQGETATHRFVGAPVSVHVLCTTYDGEVDVKVLVDGEAKVGGKTPCAEPQFTVEDATFTAGSHRVSFQVEASGGATGVVYLLEGDI